MLAKRACADCYIPEHPYLLTALQPLASTMHCSGVCLHCTCGVSSTSSSDCTSYPSHPQPACSCKSHSTQPSLRTHIITQIGCVYLCVALDSLASKLAALQLQHIVQHLWTLSVLRRSTPWLSSGNGSFWQTGTCMPTAIHYDKRQSCMPQSKIVCFSRMSAMVACSMQRA